MSPYLSNIIHYWEFVAKMIRLNWLLKALRGSRTTIANEVKETNHEGEQWGKHSKSPASPYHDKMQLIPNNGTKTNPRLAKAKQECAEDRMQGKRMYEKCKDNLGVGRKLLHQKLVKERKATPQGRQYLLQELAAYKQTMNTLAGKWCRKNYYDNEEDVPEHSFTPIPYSMDAFTGGLVAELWQLKEISGGEALRLTALQPSDLMT